MPSWSLKLLLGFVVSGCLFARIVGAGWLLVVPGLLLYPIVVGFHLRLHWRALRGKSVVSDKALVRVLASHVLLATAFLLQYDFGDVSGGSLVLESLFGSRGGRLSLWLDQNTVFALPWNVLLFVPALISWTLLRRTQQASEGDRATGNLDVR